MEISRLASIHKRFPLSWHWKWNAYVLGAVRLKHKTRLLYSIHILKIWLKIYTNKTTAAYKHSIQIQREREREREKKHSQRSFACLLTRFSGRMMLFVHSLLQFHFKRTNATTTKTTIRYYIYTQISFGSAGGGKAHWMMDKSAAFLGWKIWKIV